MKTSHAHVNTHEYELPKIKLQTNDMNVTILLYAELRQAIRSHLFAYSLSFLYKNSRIKI